jgi:hypothetical protein
MQSYSGNAVRFFQKKALFFLAFAPGLFFPFAAAALPVDIFVIIDGSAALERGRDEAFDWLCSRVVDGLLQEGDRLDLWIAGEKAEELYSGGAAGNGTKEAVKDLIKAIPAGDASADLSGALREAAKRQGAQAGKDASRLAYTILICGKAAEYNPLRGKETLNFLRYSRFEEFPAWRVITVAFGIETPVKSAAAAFMR